MQNVNKMVELSDNIGVAIYTHTHKHTKVLGLVSDSHTASIVIHNEKKNILLIVNQIIQ